MAEKRFRLNLATLRFMSPVMERKYLRDHIDKSLFQCRIAVSLGFVLYLLFALLDFQLFPQGAAYIVGIRLVMAPLLFIVGFSVTFTHPRLLEADIWLVLIGSQLGHSVLFLYGGAPNEYFFSVTAIVIIYLFTFTQVRFLSAWALAAFLIATYEVSVVLSGRVVFHDFLLGNFILGSLTTVGVMAGYSIELYIRNEFIHFHEIARERLRSDRLLLNILPGPVAEELKSKGASRPVRFEAVSVMFADFVGFSQASRDCPAGELISSLDNYFSYFDRIALQYGLEKIKTIGDCYMVASGLPAVKKHHAVDCVLAALDFIEYVKAVRAHGSPEILKLDIRIGIHMGPVIAGVLGHSKFTYDIFGATVNSAARLESSGAPNQVNVSREVWELVKDFFVCEPRGEVQLKHGDSMEMYWIKSLKPELSLDPEGTLPGPGFVELYEAP